MIYHKVNILPIRIRYKSFKTIILRSDLFGYSGACIVVKGTITVVGTNYAN